MFSSIASFIFGSNTSATTNREANPQQQQQQPRPTSTVTSDDSERVHCDAEHTIEVTSSTPSVTGASHPNNSGPQQQQLRRGAGKTKRNKSKRQQEHVTAAGRASAQAATVRTPTLSQLLLTPNESGVDEDIDDDDWFIVEKEDDEDESLPRTDSEEELPLRSKRKGKNTNNNNNNSRSFVADSIVVVPAAATTSRPSAAQRRPNINAHSLYNGPRPHQQRNHLQRRRNAAGPTPVPAPVRGAALNASTALSPPSYAAVAAAAVAADANANGGGVTQSLYVVASGGRDGNGNGHFGANPTSMEESWFVTPPPCFTSIGPIHMETSPFENLLIEHPSMSVYHSIRSAQEATESFVNLDLGVEESHGLAPPPASATVAVGGGDSARNATSNGRNVRAVQSRSNNVRVDRFAVAQLKQELLARQAQKSHDKKEREHLRRGAIKRANMTRDYQGKAHRQRRADMQHCKIISGANNNRKSHF